MGIRRRFRRQASDEPSEPGERRRRRRRLGAKAPVPAEPLALPPFEHRGFDARPAMDARPALEHRGPDVRPPLDARPGRLPQRPGRLPQRPPASAPQHPAPPPPSVSLTPRGATARALEERSMTMADLESSGGDNDRMRDIGALMDFLRRDDPGRG
jgi:hypothetical protein